MLISICVDLETNRKEAGGIAARRGAIMATSDYDGARSSSGAGWLYAPIILILFVGGALSVAAYYFEPSLSAAESMAAGFGGLAGLIVGLFGAVIGIVIGLIGALIGIVAAGGAVVMTLFIVGSPIIAIILIVMLMRRSKTCPDPGAHE